MKRKTTITTIKGYSSILHIWIIWSKNNNSMLSQNNRETYLVFREMFPRSFFKILLGLNLFRNSLMELKSHYPMWCKCQHLSQSCYLCRGISYVGSNMNPNANSYLHLKDLWPCQLWCYVYTSANGNHSGTGRHKQTPHTIAKCQYLSQPRLCLNLMESEKQYYMCQEIEQTAANETWHIEGHASATKPYRVIG